MKEYSKEERDELMSMNDDLCTVKISDLRSAFDGTFHKRVFDEPKIKSPDRRQTSGDLLHLAMHEIGAVADALNDLQERLSKTLIALRICFDREESSDSADDGDSK